MEQYLVAEAQTQTSGYWNSQTEDVENFVAHTAHEASHLEVPLAHFEEVLFRDQMTMKGIESATAAVLKDDEFNHGVASYIEVFSRAEQGQESDEQPEDIMIRILDQIAHHAPHSDNALPYDFQFVRSSDFVDILEPHEPPENAAVFRKRTSPFDYTWSDVAILLELDSFEFESKISALTSPDDDDPKSEVSPRTPTGSESFHEDSGDASRPISRVKPPEELSRSAEEVFSAQGNRRHLLGISFAKLDARFWYFDRAGSVRSSKIKIDDPAFISTFLRLLFVDSQQLGHEETFATPPNLEYTSSSPAFVIENGSLVIIQSTKFQVLETIHSSRELYGRGTAVYAAELAQSLDELYVDPKLETFPNRVVVKFAWQLTEWDDEDSLYRLAAEHDVQGVARLYRSACITRLSRGFRGKLVDAALYLDRELRVQVIGPHCIPLYQVRDVEAFKKAFISLVTGMP